MYVLHTYYICMFKANIREVIEETNTLVEKYREARDSEEMNRVFNQSALDTSEKDLAVYVNLSIRYISFRKSCLLIV